MGKLEIKTYVETKLTAVTGVKRVYPGRLKDGRYPPTGFPAVIVEIGLEKLIPQTFRAAGSGTMQEAYDINITLLLDRKDAAAEKVQAAALPFYDQVRAAFSNDPTLGGLCWDCNLSEAFNNLNNYEEIEVSQYPQVAWRLMVIEERAYNAIAS